MADKRDILVRLLGEETVSRMSDRAGDGLDRFGDKLDATEKDAHDLDRQIGEVEADLKALAVAFARTSDAADKVDITKAMRRQQTELRRLTKAKDLLPDFAKEGEKAASGFAVSFGQRIGPLLARAPMAGMNPAVLAIGAPIAAGVATLLGTAVGGAIIGGVGIGGVAGGLALAAKDPAVKAAGTQLGADLSEMLGRASSAFVPVTLKAIDTIRDRSLGMEDDFERLFTRASTYVDPLVDGLFDAADNAMPGLIDAMDAAGPVVEAVAEGLRDLGSAIGDGLSDLAPYADEGARALGVLFMVLNGGISLVLDSLEKMSRLYEAAEIVGAVMAGDMPRALALAAEAQGRTGESSGDLADELTGVGRAAGVATGLIKGQAAALDELAVKLRAQTDPVFALIDAQNGLKDAQRDYNEAVKEHGKRSPQAQEALRKMAQAAIAVQAATGEAAGSFDGKLTPALKATLRSAGFTEAEIADLEKQFKTAKAAGDKFAKNYHADVFVDWHYRTFGKPGTAVGGIGGAGFKGLASGGPVTGPGPKGVDSVPRMLAPGEHVLTAAEVDKAGGHAAVERLRAAIRSGQPGGFTAPSAAAARAVPLAAGQGFDPSAVAAALRAAFADLAIQVFIGDRELTDIVDVQIGARDRGLKRRVGAGAGR